MNVRVFPSALPSEEEIALARQTGRVLATALKSRVHTQQIDLHDDTGAVHSVQISTAALRLLEEVLTEIGNGNAVSILPIHAELTTQEAADVLNVSRPFFVQLLEKGELPFHKTGTHRRVRYDDVITYKNRIHAARRMALPEPSNKLRSET